MTEEDARKTVTVAGKEAIHLAVKMETEVKSIARVLEKKAFAATIGRGLAKYQNRTRVFQGQKALKHFLEFDKNTRSPIGKVDISDTDFKEFADRCKKNGVDFAMVKDKTDEKVVHFFFSGKNAEVMSHLFEEYAKDKYSQDLTSDVEERAKDKDVIEKSREEKELENKKPGVKTFEDKLKEKEREADKISEKLLENAQILKDKEIPLDKEL